MLRRVDIYRRLALVLLGAVLLAFVVSGLSLALFQRFTLERRVRQIMTPYAELVAVGTDTAVAFEDPVRAQEILDSLRANPQILEADLFLESGRLLASFSRRPNTVQRSLPTRADGVSLSRDSAELLQSLPSGAHLRLSMRLEQLTEQTRQTLWLFGAGAFVLLMATLGQLAVLRRTIVQPIASLTKLAELVRARGDYQHRVPVSGTDEVARLGQSFNAMMDAIQERESELRRLTDFRRAILENAASGIISTTVAGVVTSFNPAAERLLGYAEAEVVGKVSPEHWHDPEEIAQRANQLSEELGEPVAPGVAVFQARVWRNLSEEREWTFIRKDGTRLPALVSISALRDESGHITGFVGLTSDLTKRKQDEEGLRRLNRELHAISACGQVLARAEDEQSLIASICRIICEDADYRMAWVGFAENDEARTIRRVTWAGDEDGYLEGARLTWAADQERGRGPAGVAIRSGQSDCSQDFTTDPRMAVARESAAQHGYRSCIALPLKDAARTFGVLVIYSAAPDAFTAGETHLLEQLSSDLSFGIVALRTRVERKRAEQQIVKLNRELEQRVAERTAQLELANKELEAFTYSVSHDLRAPLRHIDGFLGLLQKKIAATLTDESRHYMATIADAAKRMGTLIEDLLSFSRMGRNEIAAVEVDLASMVHEVIGDLAPETKGRVIDWRVSELPVVIGDRAMLRIVLVNLLSNAVKFTRPRAETKIEVGCLRAEGETTVFVRDNGVGFDMQYADKLFGVFQRLHRVDEFEGTGIGLANVHRVIKRHGGRTWAEGSVDGGATFSFSLPHRGAPGSATVLPSSPVGSKVSRKVEP